MKAYLILLGTGANRALPAMLTAFSSGGAKQAETVSMLRIASASPDGLGDRMLDDLTFCHRLFSGRDAIAFFRTEWTSSLWIPRLPEREEIAEGEESRLLLQALRGDGVPFSLRTDREAVEWSASALLEKCGNTLMTDSDLMPLQDFLSKIKTDLDAGEEPRVMLMCDLAEGYAAGLAAALLRFLRERFDGQSPFLGMIAQIRAASAGRAEEIRAARDALAALRDRNLVRASDGRETDGADACWLLGLPASLTEGEESLKILDWAAARILGRIWTEAKRPAAGLHTREMPSILTLQSLDTEAKPAAAFLRGSFWCLSDLFPALRSWFEHPALIRSLAPATRGGLFRKLFRDAQEGGRVPEEVNITERAMRALTLEILSLIRSLPPLLREAEKSDSLWDQAVRACGRTVTLGSEVDVRRREAEESGVDKVQPVHRVSMSDTEEEEMIRRLDQMASELKEAQAEREELFRQGGGWMAHAALEDCLAKCVTAEDNAREKLSRMPSETPEERYALGMQARRSRLLEAAVSRCRQDLENLRIGKTVWQKGSLRAAGPFAGEILEPALAEQAFRMLTAEGEAALEAGKAVRDGIAGLIRGYAMNDAKTLLKNLLAVCRQPEGQAPLASLMAGVFSVCGVEVSGLRLQSAGKMPALPLLPDLNEKGSFFSLSSAPERILTEGEEEDQTARNRGLLALMILREYRRRETQEAELELLPLRPAQSSLIRIYLSSRGTETAWLCSLRQGEGEALRRQPLAVLIPGVGIEAARLKADKMDLMPSFALWADREELKFRDPCAYLSEGDRQILTEQITRLRAALKSPRSRELADFLSEWYQDIARASRRENDPERLKQRLRIACGLGRLPIWQKDLQRMNAFFEHSLPEDALCAALAGKDAFEAAACQPREEVTYVFRETPLARENARTLLEGTHAPQEELYLDSLNTECDILLHSSDDYHEALAAGLQDLLKRCPTAEPEAVETAEKLLQEAQEPITDQVTELKWPWDTMSASVLTILTECLGKELAPAALNAFSRRLALFPARGGEILGDAMMSGLCVLPREPAAAPAQEPEAEHPGTEEAEDTGEPAAEVRADAVLPPLSHEFARTLCRSARGQSLIQPGFLRFEAEGSGVRAEIMLEGAFTMKLIRTYGPEEITAFYAHDLPTLALWPSMPFARDDWRAYYSYAHAPAEFSFTAVSGTEEILMGGEGLRQAACQREYPLCYLISHDGQEIGAVPNLLPPPEIPEGGAWTACIDFGAAASSVIFTDGKNRWPMQGPVTVRTLMRSPAATGDLLWREFLPAVPVSAVIPAALRIFRNELNEKDQPLRDGAILMSSSLRDVLAAPPETLYTDLKWSGEKGRAVGLYLHQVMLMAALQARCGGAGTLNWRAALPEEMAPEGRERLAEIFRSLTETVAAESGIPLPEKQAPVSFASESTALGAYFRLVSPDDTRGGFMTLDLGANTADLSLHLQGREEAVRACQLPLGLHNLLLPDLLRRPGLLQEDFGFVENEIFRRDLAELQALLERARREPAALRQARYALDAFLADHCPLLMEALAARKAAGSPGRTGALILLNDCFLMMLSGLTLLQISGDSLRNDTLPEMMTLFLAGRGSLLMEGLSLETKTSLWKILTMFRNPRVSSLNLLFSAEKKMEIPVGLSVLPRTGTSLPRAASAPAAIAVRPEELMPEFLARFRREFPLEAALLFPGVYADDFYAPFTSFGQQLIAQTLRNVYADRETGRPYQALNDCLNQMMEMMQEGMRP